MTNNLEVFEPNKWQTPEHVDSWFADQSQQKQHQLMRQKLVSLLPFPPEASIRVLDIGAGDGALSLEVLSTYPKAQLVCHDFSEAMLDRARQRLAPLSPAVTLVKGDLRGPAWRQAIEGKFDAVVSSVAIHNVAENTQAATERVREIYGEVFGLVKPEGCFLNYDHVAAPGPVVAGIYRKQRFITNQARLKAETGIKKSLQELEQESRERRRARSGPLPGQVRFGVEGAQVMLEQLEWLRQAGFDEVDCFWRDTTIAIFGGFRH